jgi:tripartite-type tricarboxylate transporter receptor subunit TctC
MPFDRRHFLAACGALGAAVSLPARAQDAWPSKPIKLILPYAAGGPTDVVARAVAAYLSNALGQQLVVENKVGAGGNIASEFVAKSRPDGYTALYHSSGITVTPALYKNMSYDPATDFAPVAMPASIPAIFIAGPGLPDSVTTLQQLVEYLKANPNKASYGSGGIGNITHLGVELLLRGTGTQAVHVPYKGTAPAMTDLIGGRTTFMLDALSSAYPFVREKKVRALAVTSPKRAAILPEVPTVAETVLPGYDAQTWHGVFLPKGAPAAIVARLNAEINKFATDPEMIKQYSPQGVQLTTSTPAQFDAFLKKEIVRWTSAAREAGVRPE